MTILLVMQFYTEFSYEISIGNSIYHYDEKTPLDSKGFNFITYMGYLIYLVIDFFNLNIKW